MQNKVVPKQPPERERGREGEREREERERERAQSYQGPPTQRTRLEHKAPPKLQTDFKLTLMFIPVV